MALLSWIPFLLVFFLTCATFMSPSHPERGIGRHYNHADRKRFCR
ncbi:MAG: hypothetical protein ACRDKK_00800 [Gaiellaceae bacterium]